MEKMLAEIKILERVKRREGKPARKEPFLVVCLQDEENGMLLSLSVAFSRSLSSITIDKVSQYYRWLVTLDSDVIRLNHGVVFLRERDDDHDNDRTSR